MVAAAVLVGGGVGKVASLLSGLLCDEAHFKNPLLKILAFRLASSNSHTRAKQKAWGF